MASMAELKRWPRIHDKGRAWCFLHWPRRRSRRRVPLVFKSAFPRSRLYRQGFVASAYPRCRVVLALRVAKIRERAQDVWERRYSGISTLRLFSPAFSTV